MRSQRETAVHLLAFLELQLDANLTDGLVLWEQAFVAARQQWELGQAQQLLALVKRYRLAPRRRAVIRTLAGQLQAQQADWAGAVVAYEQSLQLWPEQADTLSSLGNALRRMAGRAAEAVDYYQRALALAQPADRPGVLNNLGLAYYEAGRLVEATAVYNEALQAYQAAGNQRREADVRHNLGSLLWTRGDLTAAEAQFTAAYQLYQATEQSHAAAETGNSLGLVQEARGDWQAAAQSYRAALSQFQQLGDDAGQMQVLANLGNVLTLLGAYEMAETCFQGGLAIATDVADARLEGQLLTGLADLRQAQGETEQASQLFEQAIARKKATGDERSLKHTWLSLGVLYRQQRQPERAQPAYEKALAAAEAQQDQRVAAHALLGMAQLAHGQWLLAEVVPPLAKAEAIAREMGYSEVLAETAQLRGDLELAQDEPDYHRLLAHYGEALEQAQAFNGITLARTVAYLVDLLTAIAADGQVNAVAQMAADLAGLGRERGLAETAVATFSELGMKLAG